MNPNLPPSLSSIFSLFRHPLALLAGVLLCLSPGTLPAQSVTFVGGQTTVSNNSVGSIVVDSSGNLFGIQGNWRVPSSPAGSGSVSCEPQIG